MTIPINPLQEKSVNITIQNVIGWFHDSEKCVMHHNITELPVEQINLSKEQLDVLILQGGGRYPVSDDSQQ